LGGHPVDKECQRPVEGGNSKEENMLEGSKHTTGTNQHNHKSKKRHNFITFELEFMSREI
jgi:hypothetical protein